MHGEEVGNGENLQVVVAYAMVAIVLAGCAQFAGAAAPAAASEHEEEPEGELEAAAT